MIKKWRNGFSLMELVIVVVIIGILLAAATSMTKSIDTAKIKSTYSQIFKIKEAVDKYMSSNNGLISYSALPAGFENELWNNYFNGKIPKSGFGTEYKVSNSGHNLIIQVDTRKLKNCQSLKKLLENQVTSVSCSGSLLAVEFNDGN